MKKVSGPNYNEYIDSLRYRDLSDLTKYILVHSKLEEIMIKNKNVVFPDFCSCDNIYLNRNLDLYLIDYDGMQIDNLAAVCTSTSVGGEEIFNNTKYKNNILFTKELDKRSSIILFFLTVFNINLNLIGSIVPGTENIITLEETLNYIGINDYELYDKVRRIFDHEVQNEFLGETLQKIERDYKLELIKNYCIQGQKRYIKKLVKK